MKKQNNNPKIIIANKLDDGRVVFFSKEGGWSISSQSAAVAQGADAVEELLKRAQVSEDANIVVSPQPVDAVLSGGGDLSNDNQPTPDHIKFQIQATGPTVRPDLGYQAEEGQHYGTA